LTGPKRSEAEGRQGNSSPVVELSLTATGANKSPPGSKMLAWAPADAVLRWNCSVLSRRLPSKNALMMRVQR
jgi:hypothetical protein